MDVDKKVEQYVKLRDKISEIEAMHKDRLKPYKEALTTLNDALLGHLIAQGADRVGTKNGTVYRTVKKTASIQDMSAFWTYVVTQGDFDMIDKRANPTRVADYIAQNGAPPPGVNFSEINTVGVKRGK